MARYIPPSIKDLGLKTYLDNTAHKHNNMGYEQFCLFLTSRMNITSISKAFGVSRATGVKWLKIHKENPKTTKKLQTV